MTDKDKVRNRYIQMYQGMTEKDGNLLEDILHPDFVLMHMTGMRQTKEEFIQAVQNGTLNYDSAHHQSMDVILHENEAAEGMPVLLCFMYKKKLGTAW